MLFVYEILSASFGIFQESAIYVLLGIFTAGILHVFLKPEIITRYLYEGNFRSVIYAALLGVPIPL